MRYAQPKRTQRRPAMAPTSGIASALLASAWPGDSVGNSAVLR